MNNGGGKKDREENSYEWKESGKAEGGEKGKETLITETLTHKKGEADTSGNQRNVIQLWDTSIHPALSAAFLLKAMAELDWGGGVGKRKSLRNKNQIEGWAKTSSAKTLRPWDLVPEQPGRTSLSFSQERLCFPALSHSGEGQLSYRALKAV